MPKKQDDIALVWFRNDLRVQDNFVLNQAIKNHEHVIGSYCFDPRHFKVSKFGFKKTAKYRAKFLIETVKDLKDNLKLLDIELFVFNEQPEKCLSKLISRYKIKSVYLQKEWTSEEQVIFNAVKKALPKSIKYHDYFDQFLCHPEDIGFEINKTPEVFTNFRKTIEKDSFIKLWIQNYASRKIYKIENDTKIPSLKALGFKKFKGHPNSAFPFKGGETAANERLKNYFFKTKKIGSYKKTRDELIGTDFSSKLSPWLANGSISARTIYWKVKKFEKNHFKNQSTYWLIFELIWRDYFKYISLKHGDSIFKVNGIQNRKHVFNSDKASVRKWINGETKSAFVNANMRELKKTGWMSNRGRQNVASYFSKDLKLDWRIGAAYFESMLLDYDVHSNYGNWMYVAGVGNDPTNKKFNTDLQAKQYDPHGHFQRLWLEEFYFNEHSTD